MQYVPQIWQQDNSESQQKNLAMQAQPSKPFSFESPDKGSLFSIGSHTPVQARDVCTYVYRETDSETTERDCFFCVTSCERVVAIYLNVSR
jgi:hypothetical protein